jgi:hypothetical protein
LLVVPVADRPLVIKEADILKVVAAQEQPAKDTRVEVVQSPRTTTVMPEVAAVQPRLVTQMAVAPVEMALRQASPEHL